jgi:O-antigen/teichoic acid export membrane protein
MFQGLYLVGSIGLVITKRTKLYPVATGTAAAVTILANLARIPRYGILGAAWANTCAYATLAILTVGFSWRVYPIPYEWGRLARVAMAAGVGYIAAISSVPAGLPALARIAGSGGIMVAVYGLSLYVTGFFHAGELRRLGELRRRVLARRSAPAVEPSEPPVEMAGEIIATAPEPPVSPDSRSPRR